MSPKGFACIAPERRREIARLGGIAAQAGGKAHQFTSEEAVVAGRKGGRARQALKTKPKLNPSVE